MINKSIGPASADIAKLLIASYHTDRGVHSETVIGAAAALAGEFALRAAESELPDSSWVISERSNSILFQNDASGQPTLWDVVRHRALQSGADADGMPDPITVVKRVASAIGQSPYPPLSVPGTHYPNEWSPNACPRFRKDIWQIRDRHQLTSRDLATAIAFAIALLIEKSKEALPPHIGATLALEIMIGVSRMTPLQEPVLV